jgi:hypothetical protein
MDFDNFIIGKKTDRRGEGRVGTKKATSAYQSYIEVSKKAAAASQT